MEHSDEELLKLDSELEDIFNTQGWPKTRMPSKEHVHLARKGFSAACKKYNASVFARQSLSAAFDCPTWTEKDYKVPTRDGSTI